MSEVDRLPAPRRPGIEERTALAVRNSLWALEDLLYLIVGLLLVTAAVLVVIGTISSLIGAINTHENAVDIGVMVLDRVLLTLIVAELLHTLRFVVLRDRIVVEPFLFVGLIAVVRRILIVTAELERQAPAGRALTNYLLELGLLGVLTLALAVAIFLVRRSGTGSSEGLDPEPHSPDTPLPVSPLGSGSDQPPL
jgi:uncharacterized membrane protein (DUF373 family)